MNRELWYLKRIMRNKYEIEFWDMKSKNSYGRIIVRIMTMIIITYTIIQSIMRSEMCSLHLTHPSVHTWSSGQPTVQRPGSSRGLPVGAGFEPTTFRWPRVSSPTLYPLAQRLPSSLHLTHPKRIHTWSSGQPLYGAQGSSCLAQGHFRLNSCRPGTRTRKLQVTGPTL